MSIRTKLISMFLALALVPLFFVSTVMSKKYSSSLQSSRYSKLKDVVAFKAERIERYFEALKSNMEIVQNLPQVGTSLPTLAQFSKDPSAPEFLAAKKMLDRQLPRFQAIMGLVDIMLLDKNGSVVYASNPGYSREEWGHFLPDSAKDSFIMGKKGLYVSDLLRNKAEDNKMEVVISAPAVDRNGSLTGVIVFETDATALYDLIQDNAGLGRTGDTLIGKKKGQEIFFLNKPDAGTSSSVENRLLRQGALDVPMREAVQGKNGVGMSVDYRGKPVIAAWQYIPSIGWGVVVKIDSDEAFADVSQFKGILLLILAVLALLAGVLAILLARSIANPIKKLSEGAALIGAGRLDHKVVLPLNDEIGQLSRSFDKMTSDLKSLMTSRNELNREVEERKLVEKALWRERNNLQTIFDVVHMGLLLIDEHGVVKRVNKTISLWGIGNAAGRLEMQPGDVLGCSHALETPAGCGRSLYCAQCSIRNAFEAVLQTHRPVHGIETEMACVINNSEKKLWVEISIDPLILDGKRHVIIAMNDISERKIANMALSAKQAELQTMLDTVPAAIFYKDRENRFLRINTAFSEIMGMPKEDLEGHSLFDVYSEEQAREFAEDDKEVIESGVSKFDIIEPMQIKDQLRWLQTDKIPYRNAQGEIVGVIGLSIDITERKKMEDELRKLNRILLALTHSTQAILHAGDEPSYLDDVCRIIVNDCGHSLVWVGFAQDDEAKSVRPVSQAGFRDGYLETLQITWADTERGQGPTGAAIRTGKPCLCRNMKTDTDSEPWSEEMLNAGYASSAVFPLISNGKTFGAISIYSKKEDSFSEDEVFLLQELAENLSYGITAIRIRDEHHQAEAAILKSLQRFEFLATTASELLQAPQPLELVDTLCRRVMAFLDCQVFFNFLTDEKVGRLHLNACAGIPEEEARRLEWLDKGVAVCGCVARDGCRVVAEHIQTSAEPRDDLVRSYGVNAYACHPLLEAGGKVIGTLSFGTRTRETFSPEDVALMKAVADQVSMAMIRMQDEQELQRIQLDATRMEAIRTERQRLYSVLEALPVFVVIVTPDQGVSFSNRFFRERFGTESGRYSQDGVLLYAGPGGKRERLRVLEKNEPYQWEWAGPDRRYYDIHAFPFKEVDGSIHIMEMGIDITDRKQAQEEVLATQREMDRAKRLSDIGTLAATVAHELRNPLAAISMATENIRRKAANPNLEKHLSNISLKVGESDQIINNLLFYSRLRPPHPEPVRISDIIEECVDMVEKNSGKRILFVVNTKNAVIEADPLQMKEIFNNILHNACDAVPPEGGRIDVFDEEEDSFWRVVVRDNGHGMDAQDIRKVFDPFFTTKAKGTGLGLSVCQQIVSFHGGSIHIESESGKGTSVILCLPKRLDQKQRAGEK